MKKIGLLFLICLNTWAADKNLISSVDIYGSEKSKDVIVEIRPLSGHHFNLKAPNSFAGKTSHSANQPKKVIENHSKSLLTWKVVEPGRSNLFEAAAYICDDAKTFCKKQTQEVSWIEISKKDSNRVERFKSSNTKTKKMKILKQHGFIVNDIETAKDLAKKSGKPVLIDFFAIWCPPCNQLDEDVFSKPGFKEFAKNYILLKLDVDSEVSFELKSKYKIAGYPTVIFANSDLDEITRVVGFYPIEDFVKTSKLVLQNPGDGFESLKKMAEQTPSDQQRRAKDFLGLIYLERKEYKDAVFNLKDTAQFRDRYLEAEIELAKKNENFDKALEKIKKLEADFPMSLVSFYRLSDRIEILEKLKRDVDLKVTREGLVQAGSKMIASRKFSILDRGDILGMMAEATEALIGDAKKVWKQSADTLKKGLKTGYERGVTLEYGYALWKSGEIESATKIYQKMIKKYPKEFTYHYALGSMWLKNKKPELALQKFNDAFRYAYGDHRLRVALNKAKALRELSKKSEAQAFLKEVIDSVQSNDDPALRTGKYLEQLITMKKELE